MLELREFFTIIDFSRLSFILTQDKGVREDFPGSGQNFSRSGLDSVLRRDDFWETHVVKNCN